MKVGTLLLGISLISVPLFAAGEKRLHALFDRAWEEDLRDRPLFATSVGRHEYNDRLPSVTPADLKRAADRAATNLAELKRIDRATLSPSERANYDIFQRQLEDDIAGYRLGDYQIPINADSGFHTSFSRLPKEVPLVTTKDYQNYIARLRAWPRYVDQQIALMRTGLQRGMTVARVTLEGYDRTIAAHVVDDPAKSVFWVPFKDFPVSVPSSDHERLRAEGRAAVVDGAIAGYRRFLDFFQKEYLPGARTTLGASQLPDGQAYYAQKIREFTTLDLTADQIHKTGLAEVERIGAEMNKVMKEVGFKGTFAEFLQFLRTDPRFYAKTPEELLMRASRIAKRMDGKLPSLF
ncbi:MAG TPA: DUF885 domain-containing protein, partial [Thermoanaerobaculia bacterium]|nr:DUF885 domain-containing protein [Thermoanaerobaculia bacterium]